MNYEIHGNTIPHLHMHLFPRFDGDPFEGRPIDGRQTTFERSETDLAALADAISPRPLLPLGARVGQTEIVDDRAFTKLVDYLERIPAVSPPIGHGIGEDGRWWVKFAIDIEHPLAWNVVQELGHVLNYLSIEERLPTVFMPVSPPPYLNGGPSDFLSWVIESTSDEFLPGTCADWLEGRLPRPVDAVDQWTGAEG